MQLTLTKFNNLTQFKCYFQANGYFKIFDLQHNTTQHNTTQHNNNFSTFNTTQHNNNFFLHEASTSASTFFYLLAMAQVENTVEKNHILNLKESSISRKFIILLYLSGLNMMEGILTKSSWCMVQLTC